MERIDYERKGALISVFESVYNDYSFFVSIYYKDKGADLTYEVTCADEESREIAIEWEKEKAEFLVDNLARLEWKLNEEW